VLLVFFKEAVSIFTLFFAFARLFRVREAQREVEREAFEKRERAARLKKMKVRRSGRRWLWTGASRTVWDGHLWRAV
jgi:hypothetical protein